MARRKTGMISLEQGDVGGTYEIIDLGTGESLLIQTDQDFPGIASSFGWAPCKCGRTDGTVDCPHKTASQMISEAADFLDEHIGDEIEDPGYFLGDDMADRRTREGSAGMDPFPNPPFTKGHFELIAEVLRINRPAVTSGEYHLWRKIASDFVAELRRLDARFDAERFLDWLEGRVRNNPQGHSSQAGQANYPWVREHGADYDVPDEIQRLVNAGVARDASWHNDISPHFEIPGRDGYTVSIWVDHPDPDQRELGGTKRFGVEVTNPSGSMKNDGFLFQTDDAQEAVGFAQQAAKQTWRF